MFKKLALLVMMMCVLSLGWIDSGSIYENNEQAVKTLESNSNGLSDLTQLAPFQVNNHKNGTQVDLPLVANKPETESPHKDDSDLPGTLDIVTIVIDPGHGPWVNQDLEPIAPGSDVMKRKYGVGTTGNISGTRERDINLNVSLQLRDMLMQAGFKVIMTRTTNDIISSNIDRANLANENNADLMIRIHCDSLNNTSIHGASILVPGEVGYAIEHVDISRHYGEIILETLVHEVGMANRGVITRTDQTGFNWSKVPIVTVEMGFLSNPEEDALLSTSEYQEVLANALYIGILKCFE